MTASAADRSHSEKLKMTVSERSIGALTVAVEDWGAGGAGGAERPTVSGVRMPDSGGLSSASVLFEACWAGESTDRHGSYVARMAPEASAVPVFPSYDLPGQFEVISRVAACCDIPVPKLRWNEPDGGALGTPFFVMDQVDGRIPLDNPPLCVHPLAAGGRARGARAAAAGQRPHPGRGARDPRARGRVPRAVSPGRTGRAAVARPRAARLLPLGAGRRRLLRADHRAGPDLARAP